MIEYIAIITLVAVIILLVADRYFIVEQHQKKEDKLLDELSKALKAVISKNANDYVMTTSIDKVAPETKAPPSPDEIPEESLNDDQFFKAIGNSLKIDEK